MLIVCHNDQLNELSTSSTNSLIFPFLDFTLDNSLFLTLAGPSLFIRYNLDTPSLCTSSFLFC
jgi:hypothetical protein